MNTWNKVMLGLILVLGITACFLSAQSLIINSRWGKRIEELKTGIEKAHADHETLMDYAQGLPAKEVLEQKMLWDRGEVWKDCVPGSFQEENRFVEVDVVLGENTTALKENDTVFVFDRRAPGEGGKFLGRFFVIGSRAKNVSLKSVDILTENEIEDIRSSVEDIASARENLQNPADSEATVPEGTTDVAATGTPTWAIYSKCPFDRPDFFEGMTETELRQYLSPEFIVAYAQEDHVPQDFGGALTWYYRNRVEFLEALASAERTKQELQQTRGITDEQIRYLRGEVDRLNGEIALMQSQEDEVTAVYDELNRRNEKMRQLAETLQVHNAKLVEAIKEKQLEILRKNTRTLPDANQTVRL